MTTSDLVLLAYIIFLVPAMLVGLGFARRRLFVPHHKLTMTTITIINWLLIIFVMAVTYDRDVAPQVPQNLKFSAVFIPTLHLLTGLTAQLLATYLVIRMWFEKRLPEWVKVKNIKPYMRTTLALWLLTAVLGLTTWAVFYRNFLSSPPTVSAATTNLNPGATVVQMVSGNMFDKTDLTIPAGTTVHFVNADTKPHTVTADDGSFDSGKLQPGQTFDHNFSQPGDVTYYCTFHGDVGKVGMSAVIHVTGKAVASAATTVATSVPTSAVTVVATSSTVTQSTTASATQLATVSATTSANTAAQSVTVTLNDDVFTPTTLTVAAGTAVHFVNNGKHRHTVTADDGSFDSGQLKSGDTFDHTFDKAGDVPLYCSNHGDKGGVGMSMVMHVTGSGGTAPAATPITTSIVATLAATQSASPVPQALATQAATLSTKQAVTAAAIPSTKPVGQAATAVATISANTAQSVTVTLNDDVFTPTTLTVAVGTSVHFVNNGKHRHTVTADDGSFDSGQLKSGDTFDHTFDKAGDVPLYCSNHGDKGGVGMSMVMHVTAAGSTTTQPQLGTQAVTKTVPTTVPTLQGTQEATKAAVVSTASALTPVTSTPVALSDAVVAALKSLVVGATDTPNKTAYLAGVKSQTALVDAQGILLRDALKQGHIEDAQAAAEAIVNIISGAPGQDLDKNGTINQPGDGFGLKMYMFNANETISTAQNTAGLPDNLHTLLAAAQTNGTTILKDLNDVSTQATAFTATASLVKARELEPALSAAITTLDGDTATLVQAAATLNISGNTLITSS